LRQLLLKAGSELLLVQMGAKRFLLRGFKVGKSDLE
jgi:hypothetical protein